MSFDKKLTCKCTLRQVFICLRQGTPYTPLTHWYLYTKGRGRVEPKRRWEGKQFTKLGRKYQHDWLYLQTINSDKHLPLSPYTDHLDDNILLWCLYSYLVHGCPPRRNLIKYFLQWWRFAIIFPLAILIILSYLISDTRHHRMCF